MGDKRGGEGKYFKIRYNLPSLGECYRNRIQTPEALSKNLSTEIIGRKKLSPLVLKKGVVLKVHPHHYC